AIQGYKLRPRISDKPMIYAGKLNMKNPITRAQLFFALALFVSLPSFAADTTAEIKNIYINGGVDDGNARLVIEAKLKGLPEDQARSIFAVSVQHSMKVSFEKITHAIRVQIDVLQGDPKEIPLTLSGEGEV